MHLYKVRNLIFQDIEKLDKWMKFFLKNSIPLINDVCHYTIYNGGKKIRSILCLLSAKSIFCNSNVAIILAMIIEIVHTATLLHDDVIDSSKIRRGKKTVNTLWNNTTAILSGDYLYSKALLLMSNLDDKIAMKKLIQCTQKLAEGEIMQMYANFNINIEEKEYLKIINYKTAILFEMACSLPAIILKKNFQTIQIFKLLGHHIGMAFQLINDIIDYKNINDRIRKKSYEDLYEGKMTLPIIHIMQKRNNIKNIEKIYQVFDKSLKNRKNLFQDIHNLVINSGSIEYVKNCIQNEINLAKLYIKKLPYSSYKKGLFMICDSLIKKGIKN